MSYDVNVLKQKAIEVIDRHKLIFIEDVCAYLGVSKFTFYAKFPIQSNDYDEIRAMLDKNKIDIKVSIRYKWSRSDNPTAQMALYKLCSTKEEHLLLQQNHTDVTSDGQQIKQVIQINGQDISF